MVSQGTQIMRQRRCRMMPPLSRSPRPDPGARHSIRSPGRLTKIPCNSGHLRQIPPPLRRMHGSGDLWVTEEIITYDGGKPTHAVNIMEFRDGKVARETIYFGEPWDPPAWRAPWVEPMPPLPSVTS